MGGRTAPSGTQHAINRRIDRKRRCDQVLRSSHADRCTMNINRLSAHWLRRIEIGDRPAYLLIAELIAEDVRTGRLTARERLPNLRERGGAPGFRLIAERIAEDVRTGRLTARERLPSLRELAGQLGLNYTTVARAYAE